MLWGIRDKQGECCRQSCDTCDAAACTNFLAPSYCSWPRHYALLAPFTATGPDVRAPLGSSRPSQAHLQPHPQNLPSNVFILVSGQTILSKGSTEQAGPGLAGDLRVTDRFFAVQIPNQILNQKHNSDHVTRALLQKCAIATHAVPCLPAGACVCGRDRCNDKPPHERSHCLPFYRHHP